MTSADGSKKKRRGRRAFLADFRAGDDGQYSYMGNVRRYEGSVPYNAERLRLIVLTVLMAASAVAIGCISAPSMLGYNNFYVVPFFIIELIAVFITAWAAVRLIWAGSELREYVYDKTVKSIPNRAPIAFWSALACVASNVVYLCLNGLREKPAASAAALVLHVVIAVCAFLLRRSVAREVWAVELSAEAAPGRADESEIFPSVEDPASETGETAPGASGDDSPAN